MYWLGSVAIMEMKNDKYHYYRNYQIALVISLLFIIILFKIIRQNNIYEIENVLPPETIITLADIPITTQSFSGYNAYTRLPSVDLSFLAIDDPQILPDLEFIDEAGISNDKIAYVAGNEYEANSKRNNALLFIPRQTLEVIPEKVEDAEGIVKLKILIGKEGIPLRHEILFNSTNNQVCAINVLAAVYKSRWKPIEIEDEPIEFWLEKSYTFGK